MRRLLALALAVGAMAAVRELGDGAGAAGHRAGARLRADGRVGHR